jgi:SAM-dependent methyltransferase
VRFALRGDTALERLALRSGLVPTPAVEAFGGLASAGVLVAAVRLGVTARLADRWSDSSTLAADLDLDPHVTGLLLDCLASTGHVRRRGRRYRLSRGSRRWLDPASPCSVAGFVAACGDYGPWWTSLPEAVRTGVAVGHHDAPPDDPYWRRYMLGQLDLARLTAGEIAGRVPVPDGSRSLLDVGGGHGWYTVALCRRFPDLAGTVLDLPGSAAVGREVVAGTEVAGRVGFVDGDALRDDLGGPHDVVLCFNVVHHLGEEPAAALLKRVHDALRPGGVVAVLDGFAADRPSGATAYVGLFMFLSSGARIYPEAALRGWLDGAGFVGVRGHRVVRGPGLTLYVARRPGG